jgi:hypothetical protein
VLVMAAALLMSALVGLPASPAAATDGGQSGWALVGDTGDQAPPRFVAFDEFARENSGGFEGVGLDRSRDGSLVRRLLAPSHHGMTLGSVALDPAGLLVSYSSGPACTSGVAGCGPKPGTCAGEIDRYDVQARTWTRLVDGGDSRLIGTARISPSGRYLAYTESPCVPSYFNNHLRVVDLTNWSSWTIGAGLPRCHFLSLQAWTLDSNSLVVGYSPARGSSYHGADGICPESGKERVKVVKALSGQSGVAGLSTPNHPGCELQSAAPAGTGVLAVEACGGREFLDGAVRLVRFNAQLHRSGHVALGKCTDGSDVAANRAGSRWLISAYLYCDGAAQPLTKVWAYDGHHLRHIATREGGNLLYDTLAW